MKVLIILSVLLVGSLCASSIQQQIIKDLFTQWKLTHNKLYKAGHEDQLRLNIFTQNYLSILKFNQEQSDVTLGLNHFADLTPEEFEFLYTGYVPREASNAQPSTFEPKDPLPASIDWRNQSAVTPVKQQGQCGSCWAFSAVGALEGLYFINHGQLVSFSEQNLVDCARGGVSQGCNGGLMTDAFNYAIEKGINSEADYPYLGKDGMCKYISYKAYKVNNGYVNVTANSTVALKTAIVNGPVSVAVQANQLIFQFYKIGVLKSGCGAKLNHGVLAVGYEMVKDQEAFIVKNSWGDVWGKKGYVHISTDGSANGGAGACGILKDASYPTLH